MANVLCMSVRNTILAWRVIELPAGTYDVAFDWMAYGEGSSAIYVAWMDSATKKVLSLTSPDLPPSIANNVLKFKDVDTEVDRLNNASVWQRATTQITSDGVTKYKLVFAWNNTSAKSIPPGGAIDNIQIAKASCEKPTNLQEKIQAANIKIDALDCLTLAEQAGTSKAVNIVLMGRLSKYMDFPLETWLQAIEKLVKPQFLEINKKAFLLGRGDN